MKKIKKTIIAGTALAASATLLSGCVWNKHSSENATPEPIEEPDEDEMQDVYGPPSFWGGEEEEEDILEEEEDPSRNDFMLIVYGPYPVEEEE